jgi:hypothetical protein
MSSVTPLIEYGEHIQATENPREVSAALEGLGEFSLGGLGKLNDLPPMEASHASLTRTLWIRRLLERALATRTYKVIQSWEKTPGGDKAASYGETAFRLNRPMLQNEIPWMTAAFKSYGTFAMWGETAKMACPSFDLPAGGTEAGGACPGADAGQSIISIQKRMTQLTTHDGKPYTGCEAAFIPNVPPGQGQRVALRERDTICSMCVAGDALVLVRGEGLVPIAQLTNRGQIEVWSGKSWQRTHAVFNGVKPTVLLTMSDGRTLRCTADHEVVTNEGRAMAGTLVPGTALPLEIAGASVGQWHVASVVATGKEEPVFDLVDVGPEHQFTANGISVSNCYATAGNYPSPHVQAAEIIRYWWCKSMIHGTPNRTQEWVDTVVRSMQLLKYPWYRSGIMPVRIHSSGDFFSPDYARAWVDVANRIWALDKRIVMWAPTRSWAAAGWGDVAGSTEEKWREIFSNLVSARERPELPNLILRASAYHIGDNAPDQLAPGTARGTTSLMAKGSGVTTQRGPDRRANTGENDPRRDFDCGVYAEGAGAHDCNAAVGIDGARGCRVCWTHPQVRVNFTTH